MNRVNRMFELLMEVVEVQEMYAKKLVWGKNRDILYKVTSSYYDKFKSEVKKEVKEKMHDLERSHDIDVDMISFSMKLNICNKRISVLWGNWGLLEQEMEQAFTEEVERIYDEDSLKEACKNNEEMFDELVFVVYDELDSIILSLFKKNRISSEVNACVDELTQILRKMEEIEG